MMDDPLSALDSHVKQSIFENLILNELKGYTRILVTHATECLKHADKIVIMNKGEIEYCGSYSDLEENKQYDHLSEIISQTVQAEKSDQENDEKGEELKNSNIMSQQKYAQLIDDENNEIISVNKKTHRSFFIDQGSWRFYWYVFCIFKYIDS